MICSHTININVPDKANKRRRTTKMDGPTQAMATYKKLNVDDEKSNILDD